MIPKPGTLAWESLLQGRFKIPAADNAPDLTHWFIKTFYHTKRANTNMGVSGTSGMEFFLNEYIRQP